MMSTPSATAVSMAATESAILHPSTLVLGLAGSGFPDQHTLYAAT
jgi:hypothetical protein